MDGWTCRLFGLISYNLSFFHLHLVAVASHLLLDLHEVDLRHLGTVAIDHLGELLERGALGLHVHKVHKDELEQDPALDRHKELANNVSAKQESKEA